MAPISVAQEAKVQQMPNQVCSTASHFKEHHFKSKHISRIMRCSSVTSEEQESNLLDKTKFRQWLVSSSICEKSRTVAFSDGGTSTSQQDWTEVTPALEEDERPTKVISKVRLEPEEKKLAVENDDESSAAEESISFEYTFEEKYTLKAFQVESKSEKREFKRKESLKNDDALLVVPYSIEETEHFNTEYQMEQNQPQVEVPLPLCEGSDLEPEDDLSSSEVDCAEVQVEELNLVVKEMKDQEHKDKVIKQRSTFRRHAVRKMKRSIWCITDPEPPPVQQKRKKTSRAQNRKKQRRHRGHANESFPEVEKSITVKEQPQTKGKKRKVPTSPGREEPRDSGVQSNSANSGDGGSSNSSGSGSGSFSSGNFRGEGSGTHGNGGAGGSGDDGEKGKKPWWHLPGGGENAMLERDKRKEEEKDEGQEKMDVDTLVTGFEMFLPSKVDNPEQCHNPGLGQPVIMDTEMFFSMQDLQHASYCSRSPCRNGKCKQVKSAVEHFKTHKDWIQCSDCMKTYNVIKEHAQFCSRPGCRVPNCDDIRKKKKAGHTNTGKPAPPVVQREPVQVPQLEAWNPPITLPCIPLWDKTRIDGKVIFRNSHFIPPDYFSEHVDYNVNRKEKVGRGSNGNIYPVYLQSDRSKKIVVKETHYAIGREEVEVYKLLGDHENIVKHYAGTFRGIEGRANIFMEKCDTSLYHYMDEVLKRRLSVHEAMYFWLQVVNGVNYLHSLPTPVIHKDIKAKNVLLTEEFTRAKLADYDSARWLRDEFTEAGLRPLGTKGFVAPEVLGSRPHGRPADVHSLGCFLIEMIVGVPDQETLQEKINQLGELDRDLAQLVEACVRENPEERPTARSLLESPVVRRYARS